MYRLYGFFTQNTKKVLYVLDELGVDFEFKFVDLFKGENKQDNFRKLTPVGKVPLLEHDGVSLFESGAICRYVANVADSPLYPQQKMQRAQVDQWLDFFCNHLGRWLTILYFEKVLKVKGGFGEPNPAKCEEAKNFVDQMMPIAETALAQHQYLTGDTLTIADLCAFAYVEQAGAIEYSLDAFPKVKAWAEKLDVRPGIQKARSRLG